MHRQERSNVTCGNM